MCTVNRVHWIARIIECVCVWEREKERAMRECVAIVCFNLAYRRFCFIAFLRWFTYSNRLSIIQFILVQCTLFSTHIVSAFFTSSQFGEWTVCKTRPAINAVQLQQRLLSSKKKNDLNLSHCNVIAHKLTVTWNITHCLWSIFCLLLRRNVMPCSTFDQLKPTRLIVIAFCLLGKCGSPCKIDRKIFA